MATQPPPGSSAAERRMLALLDELMADPGYVDGDVPFRGTLRVDDARTIAADVHEAIDQATEKRAELIVQQGHTVACHPGCNSCCEQLVMIWAAEAELIAEWLRDPAHAAARARFLAAYPRWREGVGDGIERVHASRKTGEERPQLAALMNEWRKRVLCAFNHDGKCDIYPVRPALCRSAHAVDRSDLCHPAHETGSVATSMTFVPLEEFLKKTRRLAISMHHALGAERHKPEAVCEAVYRRLDRR
jgi:hypothetical protein